MSASNETTGMALGAEQSAGNEREPIAVFGVAGVVEGWIAKPEGRVSDGLNKAARVRVETEMPDGSVGAWREINLTRSSPSLLPRDRRRQRGWAAAATPSRSRPDRTA
jgi:hypothetical protein